MNRKFYSTLKAVLVVTSVITSALSTPAQAELIEYKYNGIDLVYSTVSDVSWLKDADLFCTMTKRDGSDTVVNNIINANGGKFYDEIERQTIELQKGHFGKTIDDGFRLNKNGCILPNWYGAMAFIKFLNTIQYGGLTTWQLPTVLGVAKYHGYQKEFNADEKKMIGGYNGPFNGKIFGNEFPELFYQELKALPHYNKNGTFNNSGVGIQNSPYALQTFYQLRWHQNVADAFYWTQNWHVNSLMSGYCAFFDHSYGLQHIGLKSKDGIAWPITRQIKPDMVIVGAFYGKEGQPAWDVNGKRVVDTIRASQSSKTSLNVPANMNQYFGGDPLPNQPKIVAVQVQWGNRTFNLRQIDGKELKFPGVEGTDYYLYKQ